MNDRFDLLVIGTGPAGATVAAAAAAEGLKTAIADKGPFGGTCALRGCNPKKVLTSAAGIVNRCRAMTGKGIRGGCRLEWPELIQFSNSLTDPVPEKRERSFRKRGISGFHGHARFTGPETVEIGDQSVSADRIVIATGAEPISLGIAGEELLTTSDQFLELKNLPELVVFIGGGYISFEFAHAAARAGRTAIILEATGAPLQSFDPDLVKLLIDASRNEGIKVAVDSPVTSLKRIHDMIVVTAGRNENTLYETHTAVHGAGRAAAIGGLDLDKGDVAVNDKGIEINEFLQSVSNPRVYVAGDANASGIQLTPVAEMEARTVIRNITKGNSMKPDYRAVPSVVHTTPILASVGMSEAEAQEQGVEYRVLFKDTSSTSSTRRLGLSRSAVKFLLDPAGGILGAHLLGHHVDEVINLLALAVKRKIPAAELTSHPWAFPTVGFNVLRYL
jgi:glutathione reductase (NADPH)